MGVRGGLRWPPETLRRTVLLFLSLTTVIVGTRGSTCESNAALPSSVTKIVKFDHCQDIWADRGITLRFKQDNAAEPTLGVILSVPRANRWYGMGFNSKQLSMAGTKAIIFWSDQTTAKGDYGTYSLTTDANSGVNLDSSALKFSVPPQVDVETNFMYLTFVVDQSSSSLFTYINLALGAVDDVPSSAATVSQGQAHAENDRESFAVNYQTGGVSVQKDNTDSIRKSHGILNILGWGVLLPAGAIIARYARPYDPAWFYMHAIFQIIGYIVITAAFALGFELKHKLPGVNVDTHEALGLALFIIATIQISAALIRPKKEAKLRRYWNWGHGWLGRIGLFLAAVNIFVGIHVASASKKWKIVYGFVIALELLLVLILETLLWITYFRARRGTREPRLPQTSMQSRGFESSAATQAPPPAYEESNWDGKY